MSDNDKGSEKQPSPPTKTFGASSSSTGQNLGSAPLVQSTAVQQQQTPAAPADPKSKPRAKPPPAGGPNPQPDAGGAGSAQPGSTDPAKQQQLDRAAVVECTAVVQGYRTSSWDKASAVTRIYGALARAGRLESKFLAPWLKQLDDHDTARANAAAAGQGSSSAPGQPPRGGDQVAQAGSQDRKRGHESDFSNNRDAYNDGDGDGDDEPSAKRRAYSFQDAAFRSALSDRSPVSRHVQLTLDACDNYTADLKLAKRDLLRGGQSPPLPAELWDTILSDQPIDFNKLLSARFSSVVDDGFEHRIADGVFFRVPTQRPRKTVSDQSDWQLCYNAWSAAVCFAFPHRRDELRGYEEYIGDLFASMHKSFHSKVISADIGIRNTIQNDHRTCFFDRNRIQATALRYISPWGAENAAESAARRQQSSRPSRPLAGARSGTSGELCRNFNRGNCTWRDCRHAHSCSRPGCDASHAEIDHDRAEAQGGTRGGGRK